MRYLHIAVMSFFLHACAQMPTVGSDKNLDQQIIVDWNARILEIAEEEDSFLTLKGLRTAAMAHLAMSNALDELAEANLHTSDSVDQKLQSQQAAINKAGYEVARQQYPERDKDLLRLKSQWAHHYGASESSSRGEKAGHAAALAILKARENDGWNTPASYGFHPMGPGVYAEFNKHSATPAGFVFGAGWAKATGFGLKSPSQFRVPPPPAINSDAYTLAFDEVKEKGRFQSYTRSPDQTHLALWWKDFVENSHNRLARRLVREEKLSLTKTARLFALLNMSVFDAYVSSFDNKFHYNHWRPFTAIRWASNDGNADTKAEETWTNTHRHTYPFPSYPSAHGTACAAAMTILESVFGANYSFEMRTETVDIAGPFSGKINLQPSIREFPDFLKAAEECAASRVYLGIHFRYDSDAGFELGRQVGRQIVDKFGSKTGQN